MSRSSESSPRISVVTPSYNQRQFLGETLRSVLAQRAEIHEYFVLDGGSTDGSKEVIEQHASQIDFWTSERDNGQGAAIDRGFRMATGDVVYWLNSDDVLLPGAIGRVRAEFAARPRHSVVSGWDILIDAESRLLRTRRPPAQSLAAARWGVVHVSQPTCFIRRNAYLACGGLDLSLGCVLDTELWLRLLAYSPRWGQVPAFLGAFRTHAAAKGRAWAERYAGEQRLLEARYPEVFAPNLKHRLGRRVYGSKELLRGRYLRDYLDSRRFASRPLASIAEELCKEAA
jgi:glycosyltransferase involved in cell wall biosynthesis